MLFVLVGVEDLSNVATEVCDTASNVRAPRVTTAMQRTQIASLRTASFKELIVTFVFTFTELSLDVPALQNNLLKDSVSNQTVMVAGCVNFLSIGVLYICFHSNSYICTLCCLDVTLSYSWAGGPKSHLKVKVSNLPTDSRPGCPSS